MSAFNRWWSKQYYANIETMKEVKAVASEAWHSRDEEVAELKAKLTEAEAELERLRQQEPYCFIYEYDTPLGLHRSFQRGTYNGQDPNRTVKLYAAPMPPVTPSRQDFMCVGSVRYHKTGGNVGIAWSVDSSAAQINPKDGELVYVYCPIHNDHPSRHWDRTCPACIAEAERKLAAIYSTEPLERVGVFTSAVTPDTYGRPLQPLIPKPTKEQT